jgi:predicted nucleic acid-binding protein
LDRLSRVLVDSSVWSRFYRSDVPSTDPFVAELSLRARAREVVTTGVVYLELLRGFTLPGTQGQIREHIDSLRFIEPTRSDYGGAADLSLRCRRSGVQLAAIDALIAQICITNGLTLLTADSDFLHVARDVPLDVWSPA